MKVLSMPHDSIATIVGLLFERNFVDDFTFAVVNTKATVNYSTRLFEKVR
jgi:hypothetical protein